MGVCLIRENGRGENILWPFVLKLPKGAMMRPQMDIRKVLI